MAYKHSTQHCHLLHSGYFFEMCCAVCRILAARTRNLGLDLRCNQILEIAKRNRNKLSGWWSPCSAMQNNLNIIATQWQKLQSSPLKPMLIRPYLNLICSKTHTKCQQEVIGKHLFKKETIPQNSRSLLINNNIYHLTQQMW